MAAGRGDQKGAFGIVLALDVDEVLVHVRMLGEELHEVDRFGVHLELPGEEAHGLGQRSHRIHVDAFDDRGFRGIGPWHEQPIATFEDSLERHREDPLDGACLPGQRQFADDGVIAGPVERDLTAGQQQPQRDRQIKTVGVLLEVGRSEVSRRTFSGACSAGSWLPDWVHVSTILR